jgi:hypothetical protein
MATDESSNGLALPCCAAGGGAPDFAQWLLGLKLAQQAYFAPKNLDIFRQYTYGES